MNMKTKKYALIVIGSIAGLISHGQSATLATGYNSSGDQNDWTIASTSTIELGLRAKVRYPSGTNDVGSPYNDDGVYTFDIVNDYASNFAATPNNAALWSFDFSVNVDTTAGGTVNLAGLTYNMTVTGTTGATVYNQDFINPGVQPDFDHLLSNDGVTFTTPAAANYGAEYGNYTIAQNSWNLGFFETLTSPAGNGTYTVTMEVLDAGGTSLATNSITVNQIPEPSTGLMALAGAGLLLLRRRRAC